MKKILLIAGMLLALNGCWIDSLIGHSDDDDTGQYCPEPNPPVVFKPGKEVNPNQGIYHGDCESEGKCQL